MRISGVDNAESRGSVDKCLVWLLAIAAVLAVTVFSLRYAPPFQHVGRDNGVFLYGGQCLSSGQLPYVDFWDHKPPLVYVVNAVGLSFGAGRWGIWALETVMFAGAAAMFLTLLSQAIGRWPAVAATVFLIAASRNPRVFEGGNLTEGYALAIVVVMLAIVSRIPRRSGHWVLLGCLASTVVFFKPSCLPIPAGLAVVLVVWSGRKSARWVFRALISYALGAFGTAAAFTSLLVAFGIWHPFWQANAVFSRLYVAAESSGLSLYTVKTLLDRMNNLGLLSAVFVMIIGTGIALRTSPKSQKASGKRLLAATIVVAFPLELLLISAPGRFFGHYFLTLIPLVGVGVGFGVEALNRCLVMSRWTIHGMAGKGVLMGSLVVAVFGPASSRDSILGIVGWIGDPLRSTNNASIAKYLATRPPEEGLLILGQETRWNFLSGRDAPTRYTYITPLTYSEFGQQQRLDEFLVDLEHNPNTLLIDSIGLIERRTHKNPEREMYFDRIRASLPPEWLARFRATVAGGWRRDPMLDQGWVAWIPRDSGHLPDDKTLPREGSSP